MRCAPSAASSSALKAESAAAMSTARTSSASCSRPAAQCAPTTGAIPQPVWRGDVVIQEQLGVGQRQQPLEPPASRPSGGAAGCRRGAASQRSAVRDRAARARARSGNAWSAPPQPHCSNWRRNRRASVVIASCGPAPESSWWTRITRGAPACRVRPGGLVRSLLAELRLQLLDAGLEALHISEQRDVERASAPRSAARGTGRAAAAAAASAR